MIVTVIGVSALTLIRVERRFAENTGDFAQARFYAKSAIEMGLLRIDNNPSWRTTYTNGVWEANCPIGTGTYTLEGIDPDDGDLTDRNTDPLVLKGTGVQGETRYKLQVTLVAQLDPLEALRTCVHSAGELHVKAGKALTVTAAPASTNGNLRNDGTIIGDIEAATQSGTGTITGTVTVPAPSKAMPAAYVFADYVAKATPIPFTGDIIKQVLSPGYNPWGTPDPDGVYYIDTGGNNLQIDTSRIHGTLIVSCPGKKLVIDNESFLHAYRADYPVLIVDGIVDIKLKSASLTLDESQRGANYNPPGAPYLGQSDDDQADQYPTEIQGLVHIKGALASYETSRVRGTIICEDAVTIETALEIIHNPSLYTNPPEGYTVLRQMKIADGTWKQVVE
jgi:hypothetical protein